MGTQPVRIGVVGAGNSAVRAHIPRFQAIDGVHVAGVANRTRESSERVAGRLGIPRVYADWTALIDDPEIDAVFIGTWPYMHRTLVMEALEHDTHVLTHARMAMDAAEAREMLAASMRNPHLVAQVMPGYMADPAVTRTLIELIGDGMTGEILSVDFAQRAGFAEVDGRFTWRHDRDLSGLNVMLLGGRYEEMKRIFGAATSVTAVTRVFRPLLRDEDGGTRVTSIPDHVELFAEMAGRAVLHMSLSTVTGLAPPSDLWVFGAEGTIRWLLSPAASPDSSGIWAGRRGDKELAEVGLRYPLGEGIRTERTFIEAIRGEGPVGDTTFQDGVRYMEFTEAVSRSSRERRTIPLPL